MQGWRLRPRVAICANDVFTDEEYSESCILYDSIEVDVPAVISREYELLDIQPDGTVSLLLDDGSAKEDLKLPTDVDSKKIFILSS